MPKRIAKNIKKYYNIKLNATKETVGDLSEILSFFQFP